MSQEKYYEEGLKLVKERKLQEALWVFEKSLQISRKQPKVLVEIAKIFIESKNYTEAFNYVNEALEYQQFYPKANQIKEMLIKKYKMGKSIELYDKGTKSFNGVSISVRLLYLAGFSIVSFPIFGAILPDELTDFMFWGGLLFPVILAIISVLFTTLEMIINKRKRYNAYIAVFIAASVFIIPIAIIYVMIGT